jgi:DNA-binding response OmpR family regulator
MQQSSFGRNVLLVEDREEEREPIRDFLEKNGFFVIAVDDAEKALDIITRTLPDIALIDIYLPENPRGFDIARQLQRYAEVPVIFLTNAQDEDIKYLALEEYGDDYLRKPVDTRELLARMNRVLKRYKGPTEDAHAEIIVNDYLRINFSQHWVEVFKQGQHRQPKRYVLTPIESRILHMLIRNAGQVLTTEALLARVWVGVEDAYPEGLRVHIRRLRVKIEMNPSKPQYIVTQRGLGYRFAMPIVGKVLAHVTT